MKFDTCKQKIEKVLKGQYMVNVELDKSTYAFLLQLLNKRYIETNDSCEKVQLNNAYKALKFCSESWLSQLNNEDTLEED